MIRIDQLKLPVNFSDGDVKRQLSKLMGVSYRSEEHTSELQSPS